MGQILVVPHLVEYHHALKSHQCQGLLLLSQNVLLLHVKEEPTNHTHLIVQSFSSVTRTNGKKELASPDSTGILLLQTVVTGPTKPSASLVWLLFQLPLLQ